MYVKPLPFATVHDSAGQTNIQMNRTAIACKWCTQSHSQTLSASHTTHSRSRTVALAALFYSPVDFTDASDMHHSNACLMHRWINRWIKQRSHCKYRGRWLTALVVVMATENEKYKMTRIMTRWVLACFRFLLVILVGRVGCWLDDCEVCTCYST